MGNRGVTHKLDQSRRGTTGREEAVAKATRSFRREGGMVADGLIGNGRFTDGGGRTVTLGRKSQQRIMGMMDAASHQSIHAKRSIVATSNL